MILTDLETDPASIGNTLRLDEGDAATARAPPAHDDAPVRWIYTSSGTTADPKGVRHTDRTVMHGGDRADRRRPVPRRTTSSRSRSPCRTSAA